jgi:phage FluMu protein Com
MQEVRCKECPETIDILGNKYILKDIRCEKCNKLLGKVIGSYEIKCPRCGELNKNVFGKSVVEEILPMQIYGSKLIEGSINHMKNTIELYKSMNTNKGECQE